MKNKILKNLTISVMVSILLTFLLMIFLLYEESHSQMEDVVRTEAGYVKLAIEESGGNYLGKAVANVSPSRLTFIDEDGTVLYDSAEATGNMENHLERPEVIQALEKGSGKDTRLSATLGDETYYYAVRMKDGKILRVARTTDSVLVMVKDCIVPLALIFFFVIALAMFLTKRQTNHLVEPLNSLDLENPLENDIYEELSPILTRLNQQNKQIARQMEAIQEKQEEYEAITENMQDGLVVTDQSVILSINKKALDLFHITKEECIRKNILTLSRNHALRQCLELALKGESNDRMLELDGRIYQILGNPVRVEGEIRGAVIFLLDVTEKMQAEKIRREFTANVSHELKTPLMSISGYAELMMNHLAKPENMDEFAGRIYQEANRLSTLVGDIIKLSKLEEQDHQMPVEEGVDLKSLGEDVICQLHSKAEEREVQMLLEGESTSIRGNIQVLRELLYNLLENAIKYNVQGGKVTLSIQQQKQEAQIMVEDTGIGIPAAEKERIFERFYRIDKSRSKEIEGTGLGLSIVKHSVALHHGTIDLESIVGRGTRIKVTLPVK